MGVGHFSDWGLPFRVAFTFLIFFIPLIISLAYSPPRIRRVVWPTEGMR